MSRARRTAGPGPMLEVRPVTGRAVLFGLGGAAALLAGAAVVAMSVQMWAEGLWFLTPLFGPAGLACIGIGVLVLSYLADMLRLPQPLIAVSHEGLLDRRLSPEILPWESLRWHRVIGTGRGVGDSVLIDTDRPLAPRAPQRVLARLFFWRGYLPWPVLTVATDCSAEALATALLRFLPAERPEEPTD